MSSKFIQTGFAGALLFTGLLSTFAACSDDSEAAEPAADGGSVSAADASQERTADAGSDEVDAAPAETEPKADAATRADGVQAAQPMKLKFELKQVAPGEEGTQCMQLRLPNTAELNVTKIHNTISRGSHHFIVTALSDKAAEESPLQECRGFAGALLGAPLTITQKHDDVVTLPEGIGYRLHAEQVMHLEVHYINTTEEPIDIVAETELFPAASDEKLEDGSVILMGTAQLNIPPHESFETEPKFLKLPAGMEDVQFFAITGHTHQYGTSVTVHSADADQAEVDALYNPEKFDWEAPEMKSLSPHARVPKNGGFLLQCAWTNTSDAVVQWGESATAEMCFFWGYYYPRKDVVSVVIDDIPADRLLRSSSQKP
jgi:hypothetical protein